MMASLAAIAVPLTIAFAVRWFPQILYPGSLGVDQWYWKAFVEAYKRQKVFPPVMPQYVLDQAQWYPPIFPLLIARLPANFFQKFNYHIAVFLDLGRMALLLAVLGTVNGWDSQSLFAAGLIYATTPILVSCNIQMNPRVLGALFLDLLIVLMIWKNFLGGPEWLWAPVVLFSALILLTHKMTAQIFWFLCLATGALTGDIVYILLVPLSILTALVLSGGYYKNVLRAHWDIVSFWHRNWPWLQSHPVKESPIYRENDYETPTKFHAKGFAGLIKHLRYLIGFNSAAWIIVFGVWYSGVSSSYLPNEAWTGLVAWLALTLIFALATLGVPFLKCLGSGYYYLYNAAFPAALVLGLVAAKGGMILQMVFYLSLLTHAFSLTMFYRNLKLKSTQPVDKDFNKVLERLKELPEGLVMCQPPNWYDVVGYKTGKRVLWGAHGYGFKRVESTFPVLRKSIGELIREHDIGYLMTLDDYLPDNFLKQLRYTHDDRIGKYHIYHLKEN